MTDDVSPDLTLRDRFLAGTCTPDELVRIQILSGEHPELWQGITELRDGFAQRRQIPAPAWQDALARWQKAERFSAKNRARPERSLDWRGIGYALGGAALIVMAIATLRFQSPDGPPRISATASTFTTGATQQATVTLADGTHVVLSPKTTLHAGGVDGRAVTLDSGEAYFDVATRTSVPFTVRSGATTTQVLGTAFLMRHDPHHAHVRVSVTEGKVRVTSALAHREELTVTAGQIGDLTDSTTRLSALDDLPAGMERKRDEVRFYHTPVESVLGVIGQWYGFQFRCADTALLHRKVTIGLSTQSSAEVFSVLQDLLQVNVAVQGDTITLATRRQRPHINTPPTRNHYDNILTPTRENGR